MMKFIFKSLIILFLFGVVCGFDIPSYEGYVTDKVGVFSETEKTDLNAKLEEIEKTTSIELAVLIVPTVDDDINLAAVDVGNTWGVGKEGQNNGIVLLVAIDDRKWAIQVGYGLEGTLPDLIADKMGETNFPPNFREGKYYDGISLMIDDLLGYVAQDPTIVQYYSNTASSSSTTSDDDYTGIIFIIFLFAISGFGRRVTVPKATGKGRKMKKYGRWMYAGLGLVLSLLVTWAIASFIIAAFLSYLFLLFGVLMALAGKVGGSRGGGMRFGGSSGNSWGGGSSFGGFGGGSFGGGGGSGSR